jgi:hypothetical protein
MDDSPVSRFWLRSRLHSFREAIIFCSSVELCRTEIESPRYQDTHSYTYSDTYLPRYLLRYLPDTYSDTYSDTKILTPILTRYLLRYLLRYLPDTKILANIFTIAFNQMNDIGHLICEIDLCDIAEMKANRLESPDVNDPGYWKYVVYKHTGLWSDNQHDWKKIYEQYTSGKYIHICISSIGSCLECVDNHHDNHEELYTLLKELA